MLNERFSSNLKLFVTRITHNRASLVRPREVDSPWLLYHVDKWLPMLLAVVLSIGLAMLIVDEAWHLAVPVVLLIPAVILFNRYPFIVVVVWYRIYRTCIRYLQEIKILFRDGFVAIIERITWIIITVTIWVYCS